jgi:hypothetical protein
MHNLVSRFIKCLILFDFIIFGLLLLQPSIEFGRGCDYNLDLGVGYIYRTSHFRFVDASNIRFQALLIHSKRHRPYRVHNHFTS